MALQSSGQISFSQIGSEFGYTPYKNFGEYRLSQSVGTFVNLPLDSGIPQSGQIKFSDFYSKRLNIIVNFTTMADLSARLNARNYYDSNSNIVVIGGFRTRPINSSGTKVYINTNTRIVSATGNSTNTALRTGSWDASTTLYLELGSSTVFYGSGGDGGAGNVGNGSDGNPGSSCVGIEYPATITNRGSIIPGGGGGGGGGGDSYVAWGQHKGGGSTIYSVSSGGGGGGGAGYPAGSGGISNSSGVQGRGNMGSSGTAGTLTTVGTGGAGGTNNFNGDSQQQGGGGSAGAGGNGGYLITPTASTAGATGNVSDDRGTTEYPGGSAGINGYKFIIYNDGTGTTITDVGTSYGTILYNTSPT